MTHISKDRARAETAFNKLQRAPDLKLPTPFLQSTRIRQPVRSIPMHVCA